MKTRDMIGSFFRDVITHLDESASADLINYLQAGKTKLVEHFLEEHQVTHFLRDHNGNTYLHLCMSSYLPKKITPLIDQGLDISAVNDQGDTPLHNGCRSYCTSNLQLLINKGAKVNCQNKLGETPLHIAVKNGRIAIVRVLLNNGADKAICDNQGLKAIDCAINKEQYEIAALLK